MVVIVDDGDTSNIERLRQNTVKLLIVVVDDFTPDTVKDIARISRRKMKQNGALVVAASMEDALAAL